MNTQKILKKVALMLLMTLVFTISLTGCYTKTSDATTENTQDNASKEMAAGYSFSGKSFVITLYPENAPIACANFQKLVEQGIYSGFIFDRVVEDFMAQGGTPIDSTAIENISPIKGEFATNGVDNPISHQRGIVSMARRGNDPDSATCQFFICYADCVMLDGNYAAFGEVTEGMEVVDGFLEVPRSWGSDNEMSSPDQLIVIDKIEMMDADENGRPRVKVTMR